MGPHERSWATFGYFVRLLDSSNITNAYVSGMKEYLDFRGNKYLLQTFFTCGYLVGQVPSQSLLTRSAIYFHLQTNKLMAANSPFNLPPHGRASFGLFVTLCFAAVKDVRQVLAMRFLLGVLESPFIFGVLTIMGSWYTPRELSKRISIFYLASYAASIFSGYPLVAICKGLNGAGGLPGWQWLFIFCGIISIWAPIWGCFAVPDNPHITKALWKRTGEQSKHIARMEAIDRRKPRPLMKARVSAIFTNWPIYFFSFALLKSLNRFTVYQIKLFPTAAQAVGLVSDGLGKRWQVLLISAFIDSSYALIFVVYVINAASWGFWPVLYAWAIEIMHKNMEERAIVIGVAETLGQAFIAWVPVVILDVDKYAPSFHMGFSVVCGVSVLKLSSIFLIRYVEKRKVTKNDQESTSE
ncbi:major facilitator superfamily domain-containing protein [Colletotrichum godetiae]|uniref:Major facilitator superfamily domain-containing protein n=1 Tax=Colletotrichum godetiae TaxID=1209918 RepID=A0AAJ0AAW7_9PEZI|nr:major facilitator superfamily domain-containing protein [Colletotrichum godetiae]KAK1659078.1 major facilitator superfamily domain-containing protein [Colletotrichum godetiae]